MTPSWKTEDQDLARKMAAVGSSAWEIAQQIGKSRNAVIGWCSRNGVQLGGQKRTTHVKKLKRFAKIKPEIGEQPKKIDPDFILETNLHRAGSRNCRYVIGEILNFKICGHETIPGRSYCMEHFMECYHKR